MKKQGIGTWICVAALVFAIVAFVLYGMAVSAGTGLTIASGSDLFYDMTRPEDTAMAPAVVSCSIIAIICLVGAIVLSQLQFDGVVGKVVNVVVTVLRIAAPALLVIALLYFAYGSFTGLGWTFFSNEELEIYPAAKAVGTQVITGAVFYALAFITATVAAFFRIPKDEK